LEDMGAMAPGAEAGSAPPAGGGIAGAGASGTDFSSPAV